MYGDVDLQNDSGCASNKSWNMRKDGGQEDQKTIVYDDAVDDNEVDDLNKDLLDLRNGLGDNINDGNNGHEYIKQGGVVNEQDEQGNYFGGGNNNPQARNEHFGATNEQNQNNANESDDDDNNNKNPNLDGDNDSIAEVSHGSKPYNDWDFYDGDREDNQQNGYDSIGD